MAYTNTLILTNVSENSFSDTTLAFILFLSANSVWLMLKWTSLNICPECHSLHLLFCISRDCHFAHIWMIFFFFFKEQPVLLILFKVRNSRHYCEAYQISCRKLPFWSSIINDRLELQGQCTYQQFPKHTATAKNYRHVRILSLF